MTSRREFLAGLVASFGAPKIGWADVGNPRYLAAAKDQTEFAIFGLDQNFAATFRVPLPARGHAGAAHPAQPIVVAFARRPGDFALVIDCSSGHITQRLTPPSGVHFNGHGVFMFDGDLLVTSEQDSETSAGQLGLWDVTSNFTRIGAVPTHGIGPHEILLMPDQITIAVANGGIKTDPNTRAKLNIKTMAPNLSYIGLDAGLIDKVTLDPDLHKNSIRHLAVRDDGLVAVAMQWQGDIAAAAPVVGLHRFGEPLKLLNAELGAEIDMQGYGGSVSFSGDGQNIAVTSPIRGRINVFDDTGTFVGSHIQTDVCGLARDDIGFVTTDGNGNISQLALSGIQTVQRHSVNWDNHIIARF